MIIGLKKQDILRYIADNDVPVVFCVDFVPRNPSHFKSQLLLDFRCTFQRGTVQVIKSILRVLLLEQV